MPLLALVALFLIIPFVELYVILEVVGPALGAVWTIVLLAVDSLIGAVLFRTQGRAVWRKFNEALAGGKMPHREVVDGVLVVFGGAFLITPGFLTDVLGILLLLPPTRALIRRMVVRRLGRRLAVGVASAGSRRFDYEGTGYEQRPRSERLER